MTQLGHTDPKFTLEVYAQAMAFGDDQRARLEALVNGTSLANPHDIKAEKAETAHTDAGGEESGAGS
jgi:hypothetical protein